MASSAAAAATAAAASSTRVLPRAAPGEPVVEDDRANTTGAVGGGAVASDGTARHSPLRAPTAVAVSPTSISTATATATATVTATTTAATTATTAPQRPSELRQRHVSSNASSPEGNHLPPSNSPALQATHTTSLVGPPPHAVPTTTAATPEPSANPQTTATLTATSTTRPTPTSATALTPRPQITLRARAVAGAKDLGILTAVVGSTYLLADHDTVFPFAIVACVLTVSSVVVKYALSSMPGVRNRSRVRHLHHHRHFCGERAQYVRTNQRLAMMDRDFTPADYEMLLDLDNHSQRFRRFLEGASQDTIARLPTFVYRKPKATTCGGGGKEHAAVAAVETAEAGEQMAMKSGEDEIAVDGKQEVDTCNAEISKVGAEESSLLGATARKCMICLEDFEDGMLILTLPCLHRFMSECIEPWLTQQAKCPVCKNGLEESMNSMPPGFC